MASAQADSPRYWTPGRMALATLVAAAVTAVFAILFYLQAAVFCLFFGIIIATALRRPVLWLERRGLQHMTAVVIVFGALGILLLVAIGIGIPLIASQAIDLRNALPGFYTQARLRLLSSSSGLVHQFAAQLSPTLPWLSGNIDGQHASFEFAPPALGYLGEVLSAVLLCIATLMLAFYWLLQEDRSLRCALAFSAGRAARFGPRIDRSAAGESGRLHLRPGNRLLRDRAAHVHRLHPHRIAARAAAGNSVRRYGSGAGVRLVGQRDSGRARGALDQRRKILRRRRRHHGHSFVRQFLHLAQDHGPLGRAASDRDVVGLGGLRRIVRFAGGRRRDSSGVDQSIALGSFPLEPRGAGRCAGCRPRSHQPAAA